MYIFINENSLYILQLKYIHDMSTNNGKLRSAFVLKKSWYE